MATATDRKNKALYDKAMAAGRAAAEAKVPTPMVVGTPTTPLGNDIDRNKPTYYVAGGVCGFAWVNVRPGNCSFARWLSKNGIGHKGYYGGWEVSAGLVGGQSMEIKEAWAGAFAAVLRDEGIDAFAQSRMD